MKDEQNHLLLKTGVYPPSSDIPRSSIPGSWLITGGAGFIGCNLIKCLLAHGVPHIRILDNMSVGARKDLHRVCSFSETDVSSLVNPSNVDRRPTKQGSEPLAGAMTDQLTSGGFYTSPPVYLIAGDVRDASVCLDAAKGMEVIVHLAANSGVAPSVENPRLDMETNVVGTLNMLEAARESGTRSFIFASSGASVGECRPPIHEELAAHPVSPYGASKLAGEGYCSAYYRTFGVRTVILRFGNVYGPYSGHKSSVIAKFIRQALSGAQCQVYGDGRQTRDFIFVDDLVSAILKAAEAEAAGEVFQIATSREHTVNEVAELLQNHLRDYGISMNIVSSSPRRGDVARNFSDIRKASLHLNWEPQVDIGAGLAQTITWFLEISEHVS